MSDASSSGRKPTVTRLPLRPSQITGVSWLLSKSAALLLSPISGGKTRTVLEALARILLVEPMPVLIVATVRIAVDGQVWEAEAKKWGLPFTFALVHGSARQRKRAVSEGTDAGAIMITTYDLLHTVEVKGLLARGGIVIFDEITYLKGFSHRVKSIRKFMAGFTRRWGLTGTPASEHLSDLFYPVQMLDLGERFGKVRDNFMRTFFRPVDFNEYKWVLREGAESQIHEKLSGLAFRLPVADLPDVRRALLPIAMNDAQRRAYRDLEGSFLTQVEGRDVVAAGQGVLGLKLRQVCTGGVYSDGEWLELNDARIAAVSDLLDSGALDTPALLIYEFAPTRAKLLRLNGVISLDDDDAIVRWNRGECRGLVMHPRSGGHGLNLQFGGRHLVWVTLPWSAELYQQVVGRLRRTEGRDVVEHVCYAPGTIEEIVAARLEVKQKTEKRLLDHVEQKSTQ